MSRDNLRGNILFAFRQHQQHGFVDVVVDEDDVFPCRPDQVGGESICVEYLAVIKDAFHGWQCGTHEEINLVLKRVDLLGVFLKLSVDTLLYLLKMMIDNVPS